jgi:hypothetical protein
MGLRGRDLSKKDPAVPAGLQWELTNRTVLSSPSEWLEPGGLRRFSGPKYHATLA